MGAQKLIKTTELFSRLHFQSDQSSVSEELMSMDFDPEALRAKQNELLNQLHAAKQKFTDAQVL